MNMQDNPLSSQAIFKGLFKSILSGLDPSSPTFSTDARAANEKLNQLYTASQAGGEEDSRLKGFSDIYTSMSYAQGRAAVDWANDESAKKEILDRLVAKTELFTEYAIAKNVGAVNVQNDGSISFGYRPGKVNAQAAVNVQYKLGSYVQDYWHKGTEDPSAVSGWWNGFTSNPKDFNDRARLNAKDAAKKLEALGDVSADETAAYFRDIGSSTDANIDKKVKAYHVGTQTGDDNPRDFATFENVNKQYIVSQLPDRQRAMAEMYLQSSPNTPINDILAGVADVDVIQQDRAKKEAAIAQKAAAAQEAKPRDKSGDQAMETVPTAGDGRLSKIGGTVEEVEAAIKEKPFTPEQKAKYDAARAEGKNQIEAFTLATSPETEAAKEETADNRQYTGLSEDEIAKVKELEAEGKTTKEALREVALGDDDLTKRLAEADAKVETPKEGEKPVTMDEFNAAEKAAIDNNPGAANDNDGAAERNADGEVRDNILRKMFQWEKDNDYDNLGFTSEPAGSIKTVDQALAKFKEVYGSQLDEIPTSIFAHSADQLFNSEDHRATLMVAAGRLTPKEKIAMYINDPDRPGIKILDPIKVQAAWDAKGKDMVMKMADKAPETLNNAIKAERDRSYAGNAPEKVKAHGEEWKRRVADVDKVAKQVISTGSPDASKADGAKDIGGEVEQIYKDRGDDEYKARAKAAGNKAAENKPFANKEEGDAFRAWMQKVHPDFVDGKEPLDPTGKHDNKTIEAARAMYGDAYQLEKANPELSNNAGADPRLETEEQKASRIKTAEDAEWNAFDLVGKNNIENLENTEEGSKPPVRKQFFDPEESYKKMMDAYKVQDMKGMAENIFGMARNLGLGISAMNDLQKPDEVYTPSEYQDEMIDSARKLKDVGIDPSEMKYQQFVIDRGLAFDTEVVRRNSGGNAGTFLANRLTATRAYWDANAKLLAEDKKVELAAMSPFITALQSGEDTHRKIFEDKFTRDIERKRAAAGMVGDAMVNMTNRAQMDKMYGPNSPNVLYQKANVMESLQNVENRRFDYNTVISKFKDKTLSTVGQGEEGVKFSNDINNLDNFNAANQQPDLGIYSNITPTAVDPNADPNEE